MSSATVLAHRLPIQLILVSVRIQQLYSYSWSDKFVLHPHPGIVLHVAELPSTQQLDVLKLAPQTAELEQVEALSRSLCGSDKPKVSLCMGEVLVLECYV